MVSCESYFDVSCRQRAHLVPVLEIDRKRSKNSTATILKSRRRRKFVPTINENKGMWDVTYDWPNAGDEWSKEFGGTEALWFFAIYPRIHRFVPSSTILEIAPGFGRWTQFLKTQCDSMIAVDLSKKCIEYCQTRFASETHIQFILNDGTSLAGVPDNSIDFVFSFDSLVHAEKDVLEKYLKELSTKLTPNGIGCIHHSNLGAYPGRVKLTRAYNRLPVIPREKLFKKGILSAFLSLNLHGNRATSMTAKLFREYCDAASLKCVGQEIFNWSKGRCLTDAISIFTRPRSQWDRAAAVLENPGFVKSTHLTSRLAKIYCA
jgi:ubiquinone/menaquinone biosynthesis C-methylase UbiE